MVTPRPIPRACLTGLTRYREGWRSRVVVQVQVETRLLPWGTPCPPPPGHDPVAWRVREVERRKQEHADAPVTLSWRDATADDALQGMLPASDAWLHQPARAPGRDGLTGRTRYRRAWWGKVVLQVEERVTLPLDRRVRLEGGYQPHAQAQRVLRWRDATVDDALRGVFAWDA